MSEESEPSWPWVLCLTALAYAAAGWLALQLSSAPSLPVPLYPAAGIALAAVWVFGKPAWAGTALGALLLNLGLEAARGPLSGSALGVSLAIALGAALQAQFGCWLVRHQVTQPLTLAQPRDVWRFLLLAAPVACVVNASVASAALGLAGAVPAAALAFNWWTWWLGDALGVLVAAPAVLTLIGRPRSDWAPRRATVAVPLLLLTALLVAASLAVNRWDEQRLRSAFERDASSAGDAVGAWLNGPLQALQAVHGVFLIQPQVSREDMRKTSSWWLQQPLHLQAIGFSERVSRADLAAFEAAVRADGPADYRVFDRRDAPASADATANEVVAVRLIEPQARNAEALGVNALSIGAAAEAIRRAQRSGHPSASAGFPLTQESADQAGVVVYHALYHGPADTEAQRMAGLRGVGFVTLRMDDALGALMSRHQGRLQWCLVDRDAGA
ncbi:MAG TPA: CHASE domain-containing protein, partial [Rubrivivax sp.]|nr:CHASE domain-containing protein [Rubrivivax sp.]